MTSTNEASAKIILSITEGRLEIVGSEDFVKEQVQQLAPLIERLVESSTTYIKLPNKNHESGESNLSGERQENAKLDKYRNLFALADDKIQILKSIPGASQAEKMVNVALLCAYANSLNGVSDVSFEVIRELCQAHGCLDGKNFSQRLKDEKDAFIVGGSTRRKTIKLTHPGVRRATQLADGLNIE